MMYGEKLMPAAARVLWTNLMRCRCVSCLDRRRTRSCLRNLLTRKSDFLLAELCPVTDSPQESIIYPQCTHIAHPSDIGNFLPNFALSRCGADKKPEGVRPQQSGYEGRSGPDLAAAVL